MLLLDKALIVAVKAEPTWRAFNEKSCGDFSFFCGVMMLIVWGVLFGTGKVSELKTTPLEASFLLAADAVLSTSRGVALFTQTLFSGKILDAPALTQMTDFAESLEEGLP